MSDIREAFRKAGFKGAEPPAGKLNPGKEKMVNRNDPRGLGPPQAEKAAPARAAAWEFKLGLDYTAQADKVIQDLRRSMGRKYNNFTTSKIRNILTLISNIYNDVWFDREEVLNQDLQSRVEYLKVRLVYECGREREVVKPCVEQAGLLDLLNSIGDSRQNFIKFARYMEALVAYHRFHGGRDS